MLRARSSLAWRRRALALPALALVAAAGCKSIEGDSPVLIPNRALALSRSLSIPADTLVLAAGVLVVVDPLAPNWRIEQHALGADRYAFALTKKRFATGGDGEAMQVLRRRAGVLAREHGYSAFEVLEYDEGIESHVPIAQRVCRAVVRFARAP
ncbi:MAG: hypothetical protein IT531_23180 [Burkholderiales bacterium]|nr:hypothetical protein [Burkholderiales bacterium]